MAREGEQGSVVHESQANKPKVVQSSRKTTKAEPAKTTGKESSGGFFDNLGLTPDEVSTFTQALQDLSDLADSGIWHLGLDTDPNVMDRQGNPGIPIWHMTEREAKKVTDLFLTLGKKRPEVYKAMRALNQSHAYLQAGLILGSRFWETGMQLFQVGLNFRWSKPEWNKAVSKEIASHAAQS